MDWPRALLTAAAASLLDLDSSMGQFGLSRPLVLGPLLGLLWGQPLGGLYLGLVCELLTLGDIPLGSHIPLNAAVAVTAALLLAQGADGAPPPLALPAGLGLGLAQSRLEAGLRRRRDRITSLPARAWRLMARELSLQAAATFALLAAGLLLRAPLSMLWARAPAPVTDGLELGYYLAPWIGLGALAHLLWAPLEARR